MPDKANDNARADVEIQQYRVDVPQASEDMADVFRRV